MNRVMLPLVASVLCVCGLADAQTVTTSATIDEGCVPRDTVITVPAGRVATGFTPSVSSGVYCTTGGRVANPAWGISTANACRSGNTFYQNQNDSGKTYEIPVPLADLRLVPGQYCLHVDGGKGAKVTLTYSLMPGGGGGPGGVAGGTPPGSGTPCPVQTVVFDNNNISSVYNAPTKATTFRIDRPAILTEILTYHWNDGSGTARPGTVSLRDASGTLYGPWATAGRPGSGGAPNAYWVAALNVIIPAGTYTVNDSDPGTWAQNSESGEAGIAIIKGCPAGR